MEPQVIITLVHGTFSPNAPWTQPGSELRKHLSMAFVDTKLLIENFQWSGENNVFDRHTAAKRLAEFIIDLHGRHPTAHQYIVAHSHGGNVALHAHAQVPEGIINGVACMATPFLHARLKDPALFEIGVLQRVWRVIISSFIAPFILGAEAIALVAYWHTLSKDNFVGLMVLLLIAVSIQNFIFWYAGNAVGAYLTGGFEGLLGPTQNLANAIHSKFQPKSNLCILRGTGDEAALLLSTTSLLSFAASRLFSQYINRRPTRGWLPRFIHQGWVLLAAFIAIFAFGQAVDLWALPNSYQDIPIALYVGVVALVVLTLFFKSGAPDDLMFALALAFSFLTIATDIKSAGMQADLPELGGFFTRRIMAIMIALRIEVRAESVPAGRFEVLQFEVSDGWHVVGPNEYIHSAYNDFRVRRCLMEWLRESELTLPKTP